MKEELFRLEYIDVEYKGSQKLQKFSMELNKEEVLGIYTRNLSEIECLIDTLKGDLKLKSGRILYRGQPLGIHGGNDDMNILVVYKKFRLIENFSVAENIFVIRKGFKKSYINKKKLESQAGFILDKLGISISPGSLVLKLSRIEKILIEIIRAYILRIPIVIFKNFSSFLSDEDISNLYPYMDIFKRVGLTFIIMDSTEHIIERFCYRVILVNKGHNIWTFIGHEFSESILSRFFGLGNNNVRDVYTNSEEQESILKFTNLSSQRLNRLNISIKRGEILGLVDLEGTQIEELKQIFFGNSRNYKGDINLKGSSIKPITPLELLHRGIAIIDEEPSETTLFSEFYAIDNLAFPLCCKVPFFWQKKRYRENIILTYQKFFTSGALYKRLTELNSRDLHLLSYLKWHLYSPDIVVLIRPFSSVDRLLEELTIFMIDLLVDKGIGIIILTSNFKELSTLSNKHLITIQRLTPST